MTIMQKFGVSIASVTVFASAFAPMALAENSVDVHVGGNGYLSNTNVTVDNSNKNIVNQESVVVAHTNVVTTSNTGGNSIYGTTGEDAKNVVKTGDATSMSTVKVTGGSVVNTAPGCGCADDVNVEVKNNGAKSKQRVKVKSARLNKVNQASYTEAITVVGTGSNTGDNKIKNTTGGSTKVTTGSSDSTTKVVVEGSTVANGPSAL
jgi:hypothetical protein